MKVFISYSRRDEAVAMKPSHTSSLMFSRQMGSRASLIVSLELGWHSMKNLRR